MTGSGDRDVDVVLMGGPSDLPSASRTLRVHRDRCKIKIVHRGGYEHFERDAMASDPGGTPVVFKWTTRTRIAE